ncbi:hypothetical protein F2Q69_00050945 [Brassica cretica]|uniref:TFIIS central domain-containing protein n=1 Tax=Brassica cretica TaxID=69181 RepID=A0A8S9Q7M5_BRACR|nr:hypothetical protein F2Q69_00050945 [Brassica cretica]
MVIDITYPQIGKSHVLFTELKNPRIQSEGKILYSLWLRYLYAMGRKQSSRPRDRPVVNKEKKPVDEKMISMTTGDSNRDKVREILHKSLSKVANEVVVGMKEGVVSCDSWSVAVLVESSMFEKLGSFEGTQKAKYISILFNMRDNSNSDLRRKVLIGEISGERLLTMEKEEMASNKIQMQVQKIEEKSRVKEENRVKKKLKRMLWMTRGMVNRRRLNTFFVICTITVAAEVIGSFDYAIVELKALSANFCRFGMLFFFFISFFWAQEMT